MSLLVIIAACDTRPRDAAGTSYVVDDFGDSVRVGPARRIVSLNPVATEFLFAAGAGERVVGRTHWDHYPPAADAVPDLGNGIDPNIEAVLGAKPDLVILYMNASNRRAALGLQAAGVRTLTVRTDQIADLTRLADLFAAVTGDRAGRIAVDSVMRSVDAVRKMPRPATPPRAFLMAHCRPALTPVITAKLRASTAGPPTIPGGCAETRQPPAATQPRTGVPWAVPWRPQRQPAAPSH